MYSNNFGYGNFVFETPEEKEKKRRDVRRLFSRVFLALFLYIFASQLIVSAIYLVAEAKLPPEEYLAFNNNTSASVIISAAVQYLLALPILLLALIGTKKSEPRKKSRMSLKDFILTLFIGELLMYAGNMIGNLMNGFFGTIIGETPDNQIADTITSVPPVIIFVIMVILAPIAEEFICRKLVIDRLSVCGDHIAIIFSAAAFALLHANLYQLFYAFFLGALLGYVYTKTRDLKYSIFIHMAINFMGSVLVLPVERAMNEFYELSALLQIGEEINVIALLCTGAIVTIYSNLQYGLIIGGVFALIHYVKNKKITVDKTKEISITDKEIIKPSILNVGSILYLAITLTFTVINLFNF